MMEAILITIEEAARHLNLDLVTDGGSPETVIDDRLPDLILKMAAAEAIVIDYLKRNETGWDFETVPGPVKASILLVLGAIYGDREGVGGLEKLMAPATSASTGGTVVLLLMRLRDPAVA